MFVLDTGLDYQRMVKLNDERNKLESCEYCL